MKKQRLCVGVSTPRFDARNKVTGAEKYACDYYPDDFLWAGARRAGIAHAKILSIDTSLALKIPGVFAVLTAKDVPGSNRQGIIHKDQQVLAADKVRHCGDPVALVLAEDRETLQKAISLIDVRFDPLPPVFTVADALKPDAPLIHEKGNILLKATIEKGDGRRAMEKCDVMVEGSFEVPFQTHGFIETENGVAWREEDGSLALIVSTQAPFRDRFEISQALGLDMMQIRIISPCLGGGFGGKDGATVQCLLVLAALKSGGRPVKMWWSREESFQAGYKRHAAQMNYRLGADSDGTLKALDCRLCYDTGAYAHLGGEVMELGMEHAGGPYRIPHTFIEGTCVYTNHPIGGAMRAFGVCQVSFAFERMMDLLSSRLKMDPLKLRIKNALQRGDKNCADVTMAHSTGILPCLKTLEGHSLWRDRFRWKKKAGRLKRRGVGIAAVFNAMGYGRGLADSALAKIELTPEGKFNIYNSVSDMGQGNSSTFVQMAGEILCQDETRMALLQPDTRRSLPSGSSSASRTTYTYGNALIKACETLKQRMFHWAAMVLLIDENQGFELLPDIIRHLPTGKEISIDTLSRFMPASDRVSTAQFIMPVSKDVPDTGRDFLFGFPHAIFSFAAHLVYVEVDDLTGAVEVKNYLAVTDGGRVINPQVFEQQIHGAIAQGIGYALMEDLKMENGKIMNENFATYIIPSALDIPDMANIPVETAESSGPFGMKGVGEVGMNGPLPAIAAAIDDACGIACYASPLLLGR